MKNIKYPLRINKYLALKNFSTRRGADEMIKKGLVKINGRQAKLGDSVNEKDKVEVKTRARNFLYLAYFKPKGIVTHSPQKEEKSIEDIVPIREVYPVGRLDKGSHGLIILTNDGRVTGRLLNPKSGHEKEYMVKTKEKINSYFIRRLENGVDIEGYKTKKCKAFLAGDFAFRIILSEGKKHQIKRMCVALKNEVIDLKRTRVANVKLRDLKPGEWRKIEGKELEDFLKKLNLA